MKNEENYLDEWIQHHMKIGFDYFVIYDNNDNDKQENVCKKYDNVFLVKEPRKAPLQMYCYNHFLSTFANEFEYTAFIDADEFICFNPDQPIQNIKDLCKHDYYHLSWMVMDDNDLCYYSNEPVLKRFTRRFIDSHPETDINRHSKTLIRTNNKRLRMVNPHYINCNYECYNPCNEKVNGDDAFMNPNFDICYIKHFVTKTAEEYKRKIHGKKADTGGNYHPDEFFKINKYTDEKYKILTQ